MLNISNVILDQSHGLDTLGGLRGLGQKVKIQLFFRAWLCTCCSNMVANILPADPPPPHPTMGAGSKGQNQKNSEMVLLHIKLKGITNAATW